MTRKSTSPDNDRRRAHQVFENHFDSPKKGISDWLTDTDTEILDEIDQLFHNERHAPYVRAMIRKSAEDRAAECEELLNWQNEHRAHRDKHVATASRSKAAKRRKVAKRPRSAKEKEANALRKAAGPPLTRRAARWRNRKAGPPPSHSDWTWIAFDGVPSAQVVPAEMPDGARRWTLVTPRGDLAVDGWGPAHLDPKNKPQLRAAIPENPTPDDMADIIFALAGLHHYAAYGAGKIDPWAEDDPERRSIAAVAYDAFRNGPMIDPIYEKPYRRCLWQVRKHLVQRFGELPPHPAKKDVEPSSENDHLPVLQANVQGAETTPELPVEPLVEPNGGPEGLTTDEEQAVLAGKGGDVLSVFIKAVDNYLWWCNPPSGTSAPDRDRRLAETRAMLLRAGGMLCPMLEVTGEDSSAVLRVMNAVEASPGREHVSEIWPDVKVQLQRINIRHGLENVGLSVDLEKMKSSDVELVKQAIALVRGGKRNMSEIARLIAPDEKKAATYRRKLYEFKFHHFIKEYDELMSKRPPPPKGSKSRDGQVEAETEHGWEAIDTSVDAQK